MPSLVHSMRALDDLRQEGGHLELSLVETTHCLDPLGFISIRAEMLIEFLLCAEKIRHLRPAILKHLCGDVLNHSPASKLHPHKRNQAVLGNST